VVFPVNLSKTEKTFPRLTRFESKEVNLQSDCRQKRVDSV